MNEGSCLIFLPLLRLNLRPCWNITGLEEKGSVMITSAKPLEESEQVMAERT